MERARKVLDREVRVREVLAREVLVPNQPEAVDGLAGDLSQKPHRIRLALPVIRDNRHTHQALVSILTVAITAVTIRLGVAEPDIITTMGTRIPSEPAIILGNNQATTRPLAEVKRILTSANKAPIILDNQATIRPLVHRHTEALSQ